MQINHTPSVSVGMINRIIDSNAHLRGIVFKVDMDNFKENDLNFLSNQFGDEWIVQHIEGVHLQNIVI